MQNKFIHVVIPSYPRYAPFTAAQDHMQHSPSVQYSEADQQHPHTLVLVVSAAAYELLSESSISGS